MTAALLVLVGLAAPPRPADDWRTWAAAYTDVPTQVGAFLQVMAPGRITVRTGLGWMPASYVELANGVATNLGEAYTQAQADAVAAALEDSLVWTTSVGWQPWADWGFQFDVGYQLLTLGGSATGQDLIAIATEADAPERMNDLPADYEISVTTHRVRVGLEYSWWLGARGDWSVTARLGGEFTLSGQSAVEPAFGGFQVRRAQAFGDEAAATLDDIIGQYLHYPTVGLAIGYRID